MALLQLELPDALYDHAVSVAKSSRRPIEQIIVEWIRPPVPPSEAEVQDPLDGLEELSSEELRHLAKSQVPFAQSQRLANLLTTQQKRSLTAGEQQEAAQLVQLEDLHTLRKAKALYLLKQRNRLPDDLTDILT